MSLTLSVPIQQHGTMLLALGAVMALGVSLAFEIGETLPEKAPAHAW